MSEFGTSFDIIRHPVTQRWLIAVGVGAPSFSPLSITPPEGALYWDKTASRLYSFQSGTWASAPLTAGAATLGATTISSTLGVTGSLTPSGRLILPMGEIAYFDTTGTAVVIAAQSDGSTNMVKAAVTSALTTGSFAFDNGGANNGRLRYTGATTRMFHIALTWSATPATGGDTFVFGVAKGGTVIAASKVLNTIAAGASQGNAMHVYAELATNDYLELFVGNITAGRNITIQSANIFAMGM